MSSKRRERRKVCGDKVNHVSYDQAHRAAWALKQAQGGRLLVPYGCRYCGGVHIGHAPANVRQSLAARARNKRATS